MASQNTLYIAVPIFSVKLQKFDTSQEASKAGGLPCSHCNHKIFKIKIIFVK
jgi:hypothetical protein